MPYRLTLSFSSRQTTKIVAVCHLASSLHSTKSEIIILSGGSPMSNSKNRALRLLELYILLTQESNL